MPCAAGAAHGIVFIAHENPDVEFPVDARRSDREPVKATVRQFVRFATVGAAGTAIQYAVLWAGVELFAAPAALASMVGFALGSVFNYALNYLFTFRSEKSHGETAPKYYAVLGIGLALNGALMALLVHRLDWNYWIAQLVTTGIALVWHFAGSKWWAFRPAP
jgi:putative flippase GtrA